MKGECLIHYGENRFLVRDEYVPDKHGRDVIKRVLRVWLDNRWQAIGAFDTLREARAEARRW